jgi:ferrochelatase
MRELCTRINTKAILLVNLGTPAKPDTISVKKYLKEFLSDIRVIEANKILWQLVLNIVILPNRSRKSALNYQKIWDNETNQSPLALHTSQLANKLDNNINSHTVDYAMRYGKPNIQDKINLLQNSGIEDITILPLYPQYSATTNATIFDEVYRILSSLRNQPTIKAITPYYKSKHYLNTIKEQIVKHIENLTYTPDVVLFSFHGLPKQYSEAGDPYQEHCHTSFDLISNELKNDYSGIDFVISFQSRFGLKKWLEPYTSTTLEEYAKLNKRVVIVAPGFSVDCLETLEELAITEANRFINQGGKSISVIECLNSSDSHTKMLENIICDEIIIN